jgi:subtilisin-like proprotein convertase family protein
VLYPSSDVPIPVPDNVAAGIDSALLVPGSGLQLHDIGVRLDDIRHTYDSDLIITLIAPDGTRVLLANRVGQDTDNFYRTVLYDAAATPIVDGSGPFTGAFQPDSPLAALNGHSATGTWKLHIADVAAGDVGTLYAWSLELCTAAGTPPPPPPPPVSMEISPATGGSLQLGYLITIDVNFPAQSSGAPFTVTLGVTLTHDLPAGTGLIGPAFYLEIAEPGGSPATTNPPFTLVLHYDGEAIAGFDPATIQLYHWDPASRSYAAVPATIDRVNHTVTAAPNQPGEFALLAELQQKFLPMVLRN